MRAIRTGFTATAALVSLSVTSVHAGGYVEPMVEPVIAPEVIVEDTSSTAAGIIVPLMVLVLIAVAVASRNGQAGFSDAQVKTDVVRVGTTADGLPLYHFRYIGDPRIWEGVMAQDVLASRPDAVVQGPQGVLMVDYARLGIEMRQVH